MKGRKIYKWTYWPDLNEDGYRNGDWMIGQKYNPESTMVACLSRGATKQQLIAICNTLNALEKEKLK